jgi:hypothetical protein
MAAPSPTAPQESANATSLDELISGAAKEAEAKASAPANAIAATATAPQLPEEAGEDKGAKKKTRLVYSDMETSPEEKMARLPRYAYTPEKKAVTT